jgi:hypothetical protein
MDMKRGVILAALALSACAGGGEPRLPETQVFSESAFRRDDVYGARHIGSTAPCPGSIDGIDRARASVNLDGQRFDWCGYSTQNSPTKYDIRFERKPGETAEAGLAALKASDLPDPDTWTETKADFPERQTAGATWSKAGSGSHGVWVARIGEWRIALFADYPESRRAQVVAAANDYFRKVRAPR